MKSNANATKIAAALNPIDTETAAKQSHVAAGLDARDCGYLSVNHDRSRGMTRAQCYEKMYGRPYTGPHGHVSID